jgi:hypothetical protein
MSVNTNSHNTNENVLSVNDKPIPTFNSISEPVDIIEVLSDNKLHYTSIKKLNIADTITEENDDGVTSITDSIPDNFDWFSSKEYIIFKNQLASLRKCNNFILKEGKECKRLLDLKYADLTNIVNNIQTSVIFMSTISGFFQATKTQFGINLDIISVFSITISTYISLVLSISKYYKTAFKPLEKNTRYSITELTIEWMYLVHGIINTYGNTKTLRKK